MVVVFLSALVAVCLASNDAPLVTQELIDDINARNLWTADGTWASGKTIKDGKALASTLPEKSQLTTRPYDNIKPLVTPPEHFDSRTKWPECRRKILDSEPCKMGWALAPAQMLSIRNCLQYQIMVDLEPNYAIHCDRQNMDCGPWYLTKQLEFLESTGLTTRECVAGAVDTCPEKCVNDEEWWLYTAIYLANLDDAKSVQIDILKGAAVVSVIPVYTDLFAYKSGIYSHQAGELLGYQTVTILGWGVEEGVKYWIVENSWGSDWGMDGAIHIKWGEIEIDTGAFTFDSFDPEVIEKRRKYNEYYEFIEGRKPDL